MTAHSFVVIPADETLPLESSTLKVPETKNVEVSLEQSVSSLLGDSTKLAPLLLPGSDTAGLYVFSIVPAGGQVLAKNTRATRLAMACGSLSTRFRGNVLLFRSSGGRGYQDLGVDEIYGAACISPDLRPEIQSALNRNEVCKVSEWLANAAQQNYHDNATISRLASVMNPSRNDGDSDESSDEESSADYDDDEDKEGNIKYKAVVGDANPDRGKNFVARTSLCLQCRRPSNSLCPDCEGAYFCEEPRQCRQTGYVSPSDRSGCCLVDSCSHTVISSRQLVS